MTIPFARLLTQVDERLDQQGCIRRGPQTGISLPETFSDRGREVQLRVLMNGYDSS